MGGVAQIVLIERPATFDGALAQLASALPWHGRGQGFESLMLHQYRFKNQVTAKFIKRV